MTSWRDTASPQVRDDLDGLLEPALGFAQQQLVQRGEFYPYAVATNLSGEQEMIAADLHDDRPESANVITALIQAITTQRDRLRAVAIVANARLPELNTDAVRVTLEHREGTAMAVILPYSHRRFRSGVEFGTLRATTATGYIW